MLNRFITFAFLFTFPLILLGQEPEQFGKNRIQSKNYNWKVLKFRNFNVFYYGANSDLAEFAGEYAEENLLSITKSIGFTPYSKIRLIIYSSVEDYQESNISISDQTGAGLTAFINSRVEVPFKGTKDQFKNDIRKGVANTLISTLLYGGSFKEVIQNNYFLTLPEWFAEGASNYVANGWNREMDNYIRNLALKGELSNPEKFTGERAALVGQSIWNYYVLHFGISEFQAALNYVKVVKGYKAAIENSTGMPFKEFLEKWEKFYLNNAQKLTSNYTNFSDSTLIYSNSKHISDFTHAKERPIYITKNSNKFKIKIFNGKRYKNLKRGGRFVYNRDQNNILPLVSWQNESVITILNRHKNNHYIYTYSLDTEEWLERKLPYFENITGFSISSDGSRALIAAPDGVNSNIYLVSLRSGQTKSLTNQEFDAVNPCFIPGSSSVAFTSNQQGDSTQKSNAFKIFFLDLKNNKLSTPVTVAGNSSNLAATKNSLYFLNDQTGINNLYKYSFKDSSIKAVTRSISDIKDFSLSPDKKTILLKTLESGEEAIFSIKDNYEPVVNFAENHQTERSKYLKNFPTVKEAALPQKKDTVSEKDNKPENKEEPIDIENYVFDIEKDSLNQNGSGRKVYQIGPYKYKNHFTVESVTTSFAIDPLRGLGIFMEAGMTDLLENHKVNIGVFGLTDLKSSNVFGEYRLLKYRTDFNVRYERITLNANSEALIEKYALNKLEVGASYPLSASKRVFVSPFVATTRYTPLDFNLFASDSLTFYFGIQEAFVWDNTINTGLNVRKGIRAKASIQHFFSTKERKNFGKLMLEFRNYIPLINNITLASRVSYGQFFGRSPKSFLIGGMKNWLFNKTNYNEEGDPLILTRNQDDSDLLFIEYVTPLRGFNYNTQFGNKFLLFNAELRAPLAGNLYSEETSSAFLKNLQAIGFTDVGAGWTGEHPFSGNNSLNTNIINKENTPFTAQVRNYKNPLLIGYGFGVRTMLLGYFVRLDVAWGIKDSQVQDRKYYLTFGYDF